MSANTLDHEVLRVYRESTNGNGTAVLNDRTVAALLVADGVLPAPENEWQTDVLRRKVQRARVRLARSGLLERVAVNRRPSGMFSASSVRLTGRAVASCAQCDGPMPEPLDVRRRFCSVRCRVAAHRRASSDAVTDRDLGEKGVVEPCV